MVVPVHTAEEGFKSIGRQIGDVIEEITHKRYYFFSRSVGWRPAINIYEEEHRYFLCVELAGLAREQIDVEVLGHKLLIRGERPVPLPPQSEGPRCILRMEINSGPFQREIELPGEADMNAIEARFDNGFLCITIGKRTG